ncbi:uncharacterized protein [Mycetomoellerius zeteki]|uniref:uncharacterized protein n=1 Tax=Mycetomoellerius zeteki TaxID=64791 RepID=UPI00084EBBA9|nr:PREDICTED: uncharacterized protein LOC108730337 [Trachymyrmex zeteki]
MRKAKAAILLGELRITDLRARRAITGALVLEVRGPEGEAKSSNLAAHLTRIFEGCDDIKVARPTKMAEMRLSGLDDSVERGELLSALAEAGGCRTDEVKVGEMRQSPGGMGAVWVRCLALSAKKIADCGRITVSWVSARVRLLQPRPLQCYRCMELGHAMRNCSNPADRSGACYRCGVVGHLAGSCTEPASCPVCRDAGLSAGHRIGAAKDCVAARTVDKKKRAGAVCAPAGGGAAAGKATSAPRAIGKGAGRGWG